VAEPLLETPDQAALVSHLLTASKAVATPAEKVSLLQSVMAVLDRAVDLPPASFAATVRASALGGIAEEQRVDSLYARLRGSIITEASKHAARGDVRRLEDLRQRLDREDAKLGARRPADVAAIVATINAHLDAAHRLRLAHDQWLLRRDGLRAYERASLAPIRTLAQSKSSLDDIRRLAGPAPQRLRGLARRLSRAARGLTLIRPPEELSAAHAIFRSAYELAENAVRLRLDAITVADIGVARQAAAAASGALMLLARGQADLDAALRPPTGLVSPP